jgi:glycosyltransferase involved in cell wall biosynthesis
MFMRKGLIRRFWRRLSGQPLTRKTKSQAGPKPKLRLQGLPPGRPAVANRPTVLLITHNASRSGAPMVALDIGRRLARDFNLVTFSVGAGELLPWFQQDANAIYVGQGKADQIDRQLRQILRRHPPAAVVVNSMASRAAFPALRASGLPVLILSHEMASRLANSQEIHEVAAWAKRVILSSPMAAAEAFGKDHALWPPNHRILPQGQCAVPPFDADPAAQAQDAARLRALMRPAGAEGRINVMGMGSLILSKGCDLFLEMARQVLANPDCPDVAFFWFGSPPSSGRDTYTTLLQVQAGQAGFDFDKVFVGKTGVPDLAQSMADVFVLPSRLDTLPNVAVDAMMAGAPVVCFDRASGIAPLITAAGQAQPCLAPPLDAGALAERVLAIARDPALRQSVGQALQIHAQTIFDRDTYLEAVAAEVRALL